MAKDRVIYLNLSKPSIIPPTQETGAGFGPSYPDYGNQPRDVAREYTGDLDSVELINLELWIKKLADNTTALMALLPLPAAPGTYTYTPGIGRIKLTYQEDKQSVINVSGSTITLSGTPYSNSLLWLHRNGLRLQEGSDYTRIGNIITLVIPAFGSDVFYANYKI